MSSKQKQTEPAVLVVHEADQHAHIFVYFFMFLKSTLLALAMVFVTFLIIGSVFGYSYFQKLSTHSGLGFKQMLSVAKSGWSKPVASNEDRVNFLILGIDALNTRSTEAINTDTMMVASLSVKTGKIVTFSIPRDVFIASRKEKINGVYNSARIAGNSNPELETKLAVEDFTGLKFQHVIVLHLDEVGKIIDALGGINVNVARAFSDDQFPREGVDVSKVKDPKILYETISFEAGSQLMDGKKALQFIRSRHSTNPLEGTDDARALRQQQIVAALIAKLEDKNLIKNPQHLGDLIKLYQADFSKYLSLEEIISISKIFVNLKKMPVFESKHFAVKDFEVDPVLMHPVYFYTGQWVYLPIDPTGNQIKSLISSWLKI